MVISNGLQHIGIIVPDVEASAKWYIEKSDFVRKAEFSVDGNQVIFVYSEKTNVLNELIQRPEGSKEAEFVKKNGARVDHIAYEVDDLQHEFENAKVCGMNIIEGIVTIPEFWNNGFQYFLVYSAGGEKVEYCKVL